MSRRRCGDDSGTTLGEVLVGLGVLSTVMAIATGGIVQAFHAVGRADAASIAQSQLHSAFSTLDKEVRYAAWVGSPADTGRHTFVEFAVTTAQTREHRCHRVVVDRTAGTLRLQTWRPGVVPSAGRALAGQLVTADVAPMFSVTQPGVVTDGIASTHQLLRVRLTARAGAGTRQRTVSSDITFTAMNTTLTTTAGTECAAGRPA